MSIRKLPVVSAATLEDAMGILINERSDSVDTDFKRRWFNEMRRENEQLALFFERGALHNGPGEITRTEASSYLLGAVLVYGLLKAQIASEAVSRPDLALEQNVLPVVNINVMAYLVEDFEMHDDLGLMREFVLAWWKNMEEENPILARYINRLSNKDVDRGRAGEAWGLILGTTIVYVMLQSQLVADTFGS